MLFDSFDNEKFMDIWIEFLQNFLFDFIDEIQPRWHRSVLLLADALIRKMHKHGCECFFFECIKMTISSKNQSLNYRQGFGLFFDRLQSKLQGHLPSNLMESRRKALSFQWNVSSVETSKEKVSMNVDKKKNWIWLNAFKLFRLLLIVSQVKQNNCSCVSRLCLETERWKAKALFLFKIKVLFFLRY